MLQSEVQDFQTLGVAQERLNAIPGNEILTKIKLNAIIGFGSIHKSPQRFNSNIRRVRLVYLFYNSRRILIYIMFK